MIQIDQYLARIKKSSFLVLPETKKLIISTEL